ncbi:MAG: hypothetical protein M1823_004689 [Watsoniomyces obsoletus]|nr:MAG: hypothetical protein M1823_004689 [Watsoniomyces obsoletus]
MEDDGLLSARLTRIKTQVIARSTQKSIGEARPTILEHEMPLHGDVLVEAGTKTMDSPNIPTEENRNGPRQDDKSHLKTPPATPLNLRSSAEQMDDQPKLLAEIPGEQPTESNEKAAAATEDGTPDLVGGDVNTTVDAVETEDSHSVAEQTNDRPVDTREVLYRIEYYDADEDLIDTSEHTEDMIPLAKLTNKSAMNPIEIITSVTTLAKRKAKDKEARIPYPIYSVEGTRLVINSPAILYALQSVIEYWPGLNLAPGSLTVEEPYSLLLFHYEALKDHCEQFGKGDSSTCTQLQSTAKDLSLLLQFLEPSWKSVNAERERHARVTPVATYEMLWLLFQPGTHIYVDRFLTGEMSAYVVASVSGGPTDTAAAPSQSPYTVSFWHLHYDGGFLGRRELSRSIFPFSGEKEIRSLHILPCEYYPPNFSSQETDGQPVKTLWEQLKEEGQMFFRLTQHQYMHYSGENLSVPRRKVGPGVLSSVYPN